MSLNKILEKFRKGHKGEEYMEVAEAEAEIEIAIKQALEEAEIKNKIQQSFSLHQSKTYADGYNQAIKDQKQKQEEFLNN
jgi:hypothetical protein